MKDKVSIIIPTYNRANILKKALDSVLQQSYQNIEVIVIDDGSTDATSTFIENYINANDLYKILRYYKQVNRGPSAARNYGLEKSTGKYIIFFDSDDYMLPDRVHIQIKAILENKADLCAASFRYNSNGVEHKFKAPRLNNYYSFYRRRFLVGTQAWMFKKSVLKSVKGYNEAIRYYEDVDLILRLISFGIRMCHVEEVLTYYEDNSNDSLTQAKTNISIHYITGLLTARSTALKIHIKQNNYLAIILELNLISAKRKFLIDHNKYEYVMQLDIMVKTTLTSLPYICEKILLAGYKIIRNLK